MPFIHIKASRFPLYVSQVYNDGRTWDGFTLQADGSHGFAITNCDMALYATTLELPRPPPPSASEAPRSEGDGGASTHGGFFSFSDDDDGSSAGDGLPPATPVAAVAARPSPSSSPPLPPSDAHSSGVTATHTTISRQVIAGRHLLKQPGTHTTISGIPPLQFTYAPAGRKNKTRTVSSLAQFTATAPISETVAAGSTAQPLQYTLTDKRKRFKELKDRRVKKSFIDEHTGEWNICAGKVRKLIANKNGEQEWYNIQYTDGDGEDLYHDAVMTILLPPV